MVLREVMSHPVVTIAPGQTVAGARQLMENRGIHQLVVVDEGRVVGVIAAADVRERPRGGRVEDFMSRRLFTATPGTPLGPAAALMRARAIGCLPVVDRGRLVGIVTVSDLLDVVDRHGDSFTAPQPARASRRAARRATATTTGRGSGGARSRGARRA